MHKKVHQNIIFSIHRVKRKPAVDPLVTKIVTQSAPAADLADGLDRSDCVPLNSNRVTIPNGADV